MLDQVNELFGIMPDVDLDVIRPRQTLPELTGRVMAGVTEPIERYEPDAVVVQGDTTTSFVAGARRRSTSRCPSCTSRPGCGPATGTTPSRRRSTAA